MNGDRPLLSVRGLTVALELDDCWANVVRGVDLDVGRGETVGIVGESGSGKSMTARAIVRTLPRRSRTTGTVEFLGQDLLRLSASALREVRAEKIAMVFQDPRAFTDPLWKAGDYVSEPLRVHRGMKAEQARKVTLGLLEDVGIAEPDRVASSFPHQLSGGMLQRIGIAGALAMEPDLLIADEPTTALDVTVQAEIVALLQELAKGRGMGTIFITHDLDLGAMICDRILVMYAGATMGLQATADLLESPAHPYARALLNARPRVDARLERLKSVGGQPASAVQAPSGCPFHPRCYAAEERCALNEISAREVSPGVFTSCLRVQAGDLPSNGAGHV
jgi:oligopeptide/dipeptide ABC transporter ATP-binding protein